MTTPKDAAYKVLQRASEFFSVLVRKTPKPNVDRRERKAKGLTGRQQKKLRKKNRRAQVARHED